MPVVVHNLGIRSLRSIVVELVHNVRGTANLAGRADSGLVDSNFGQSVSPESERGIKVEVAPLGLHKEDNRGLSIDVSAVAGGNVDKTSEVGLREVTVLGNNDSCVILRSVGLVAPHGTRLLVLDANLLVNVFAPFVGSDGGLEGPLNSVTVRVNIRIYENDRWVGQFASRPVASGISRLRDSRGGVTNLTVGDLNHVASTNFGKAGHGKRRSLDILVLGDFIIIESLSVNNGISLLIEDLNSSVQFTAVLHAGGGSLEENIEGQSVVVSKINAIDRGLIRELGAASLLVRVSGIGLELELSSQLRSKISRSIGDFKSCFNLEVRLRLSPSVRDSLVVSESINVRNTIFSLISPGHVHVLVSPGERELVRLAPGVFLVRGGVNVGHHLVVVVKSTSERDVGLNLAHVSIDSFANL